jgi:hypothetical protein
MMENKIKEKIVKAKVNVILDVEYNVLAETDEDAIKYVMENDYSFEEIQYIDVETMIGKPYNLKISDYVNNTRI